MSILFVEINTVGLNFWIFVCSMDRYCQEFALILNTLNAALNPDGVIDNW